MGIDCSDIVGGLQAWVESGLPVEVLEEDPLEEGTRFLAVWQRVAIDQQRHTLT